MLGNDPWPNDCYRAGQSFGQTTTTSSQAAIGSGPSSAKRSGRTNFPTSTESVLTSPMPTGLPPIDHAVRANVGRATGLEHGSQNQTQPILPVPGRAIASGFKEIGSRRDRRGIRGRREVRFGAKPSISPISQDSKYAILRSHNASALPWGSLWSLREPEMFLCDCPVRTGLKPGTARSRSGRRGCVRDRTAGSTASPGRLPR